MCLTLSRKTSFPLIVAQNQNYYSNIKFYNFSAQNILNKVNWHLINQNEDSDNPLQNYPDLISHFARIFYNLIKILRKVTVLWNPISDNAFGVMLTKSLFPTLNACSHSIRPPPLSYSKLTNQCECHSSWIKWVDQYSHSLPVFLFYRTFYCTSDPCTPRKGSQLNKCLSFPFKLSIAISWHLIISLIILDAEKHFTFI